MSKTEKVRYPEVCGVNVNFLWLRLTILDSNTEAGQKTLAIYIGAAPFESGKQLLMWFPHVNFWLIDMRENDFDPGLKNFIHSGRIIMSTGVPFDDRFAQGIKRFFEATSEREKIGVFNEYFKRNTSPKLTISLTSSPTCRRFSFYQIFALWIWVVEEILRMKEV